MNAVQLAGLTLAVAGLAAFWLWPDHPTHPWPGFPPPKKVEPLKGTASWYGETYRHQTMANGKPFNPDALTCASWDFPFGTQLLVRAGRNAVVVEVTDRGPSKKYPGRIIDLSRAAFERLAGTDQGLVEVTVEPFPN